MTAIKHSTGGAEIQGVKLEPGEVILPGDMYDVSDGDWKSAACLAGRVVQAGERLVFVRPSTESGRLPSENTTE